MIQKGTSTPIHQQILEYLRNNINEGQFAPGSKLPTEDEWCETLNVSRYPLRQAMTTLERDGLIKRVRGKGTFVRERTASEHMSSDQKKLIALVLPDISDEYALDIVRGFIGAASAENFTVVIGISNIDTNEQQTIDRAVNAGARGIVLFPKSTELNDTIQGLTSKDVYISLIDSNSGLEHVDFVSTDNTSGGFMAARHMRLQGFRHAAYAANVCQFSSVQERLQGFVRGLKQNNLALLNPLVQGSAWPLELASIQELDFSSDSFFRNLDAYMGYAPFGLFCENDFLALSMMDELTQRGVKVGKEVGVIGFDNISAGKYQQPPLTTIAQNGVLIGETAARTAISRIITGSKQSVRHILPTQVIIRKSCGEKHAHNS